MVEGFQHVLLQQEARITCSNSCIESLNCCFVITVHVQSMYLKTFKIKKTKFTLNIVKWQIMLFYYVISEENREQAHFNL